MSQPNLESMGINGAKIALDIAIIFFFKQKTAYEVIAGDWSSDVCSSDPCIVTAFVQQEILWAGFNPDWLVIRTGKTQIIQT